MGTTTLSDGDETKLYAKIKSGKFSFTQSTIWNVISDEAKNLIKSFLTVDPNIRLTATRALKHPWFKMENMTSETCESLAETRVELKKNYRLGLSCTVLFRNLFQCHSGHSLELRRERRERTRAALTYIERERRL